MIKKAERVKAVEFVITDGSLDCLYALRKMLPHTGVELEEDGTIRSKDEVNKDGKPKFISCTKYNIGSPRIAVPVGDVVWKLPKFGSDDYDWYSESQGGFFKKYREVSEKPVK